MAENQATPSPEATGGAGVAFEFQVDAAFLAFLAVGGSPPLLRGCRLEWIHLQSGHLDWRTDDLLLVGVDGSGERRQAAIQAKRQFTFQKSDADSVLALAKAWEDFNDSRLFNADRDVVGFAIQHGSSEFFHGFRVLLDCARAALDPADFDRRLKRPLYLTKVALRYRDACRAMLEGATGTSVPDDRFFQFLRVLDFIQMDLGSSASVVEACARTMLQLAAATTPNAPQTDVWPGLVTTAQAWDGRAQSVTAQDIVKEIGWPSPPPSAPFERELKSLRSSADLVLSRVTSSVGDVEVPRAGIEGALLDLANDGGIVIVTGEPGVGKSALAARVFRTFRSDGMSLAFRPGMLAAGADLNQVLLPHGQTAARLLTLSRFYPRNVVLVESAERFLETADAERDAFLDLLTTLDEDPSWVILITCRSYAVDTFRSAFLEGSTRPVRVLQVPEFSDDDLDVVAAGIPALSVPLAEPKLRKLLRNPFYLGMASKLKWTAPFPSDALGFRRMVWRDVVRKESHQGGGMPMRRANAFLEVVRRRARSLDEYILCDDLDAEALQELRHDMLVIESPENPDALAPAHDVLEDWALQHWIESVLVTSARKHEPFFKTIGTYPAVRRAYRVWLSEWLDAAFDDAAGWAVGVVRNSELPKHWVDDTLTAALLSGNGKQFVGMVAKEERFQIGDLLHRLLHLARVACRRLPDAAREPGLVGTRLLIPEGGAWEGLLEWLEKAIAAPGSATPLAVPLYLNFLDDWAMLASSSTPYPPGAAAAGRIALRLIGLTSALDYSERKNARKRALTVALSVPIVVRSELQAMVDGLLAGESDNDDSVVVELLLGIITGAAVARELPNLAVTCVEHVFGMSPAAQAQSAKHRQEDHGFQAVERAFGLQPHGWGFGFPPSALHGPFAHLFANHPAVALDLIERVVNHACDSYGRSEARLLESPTRISLALPNGKVVEQWLNGRLWGLYRGATVGPYQLQCALMALENWLLARAERKDPALQETLLQLLERANNVATTAVVVSVAQAWPEGTWRALLPLLAHRVFFELDRSRFIQDQSGAGRMLESLGLRNTTESILYAKERKKSNSLPHRKQDLESTALQLQLTEAREEIEKVIDSLRRELPAVSERTDDDRVWEFILHRIDLRVFVPAGKTEDGRIWLRPSAPPPEVGKMLDESRPALEGRTQRLSLLMWAEAVFGASRKTDYDPSTWREKLTEARRILEEQAGGQEDPFELGASAPAFVGAVCARDHWEELSAEEREWCLDVICRSVEAAADGEHSPDGESLELLDGSMAAAMVLPGLIPKAKGKTAEARLLSALSCGVLHPKAGLVGATLEGIGRDLLPMDRELALSCLKATFEYSRVMEQKGRRWAYESQAEKQKTRMELRRIIQQRERWDDSAVLSSLNFIRWPWWGIVNQLLAVFGRQPTDDLGTAFFLRLAELLAASWVAESRGLRRGSAGDGDEAFHTELAYEISRALAGVVLEQVPEAALKLTEPIKGAMEGAGREVAEFIHNLILAQNGRESSDSFLALWKAFAKEFEAREATLDYSSADLLRSLFFNVKWNQGVREWASLKGHEDDVGSLFRRLEPSEVLIETFAEFLRTIGHGLLPDALGDVADKLADSVYLTERAVLRLELILSSLVYGGSVPIRREERLRSSVLKILDAMIDGGSSAAYRMRDDFLTPLTVRASAPGPLARA
jgi:hypothetical protein